MRTPSRPKGPQSTQEARIQWLFDPSHANAMDDGWRYVLPGEGELPLAEALVLLKRNGYDGWALFEHEKRWHPDLAAPEIAFPAFVRWVQPLR